VALCTFCDCYLPAGSSVSLGAVWKRVCDFIFADPAKVTFTPTIQYLPFRLAGVVQCYIKANPPLQYVTWTKDKRLLEPYQTKDIVIMNNGSLLFTRVSVCCLSRLFSRASGHFSARFKYFVDAYLNFKSVAELCSTLARNEANFELWHHLKNRKQFIISILAREQAKNC
jgi:hypothetical protein